MNGTHRRREEQQRRAAAEASFLFCPSFFFFSSTSPPQVALLMLAPLISVSHWVLSGSGRVQVGDVILLQAVSPLSNSPAHSLFSASILGPKSEHSYSRDDQHSTSSLLFFIIYIYNPLGLPSLKMTKHFLTTF